MVSYAGLLVLVVKDLAWRVFSRCFHRIQRVLWMFTGTHRTVVNNRLPSNYHQSAQVLKIIARYKFDQYIPQSSEWDFVATHELCDSPDRVLQDHISLYQVTNAEAIFTEALPGVELWKLRYAPFFVTAQFRHAVRLVRMPISSFHRLAEQLGDPDNLTFVVTTARCGSTLLVNMFAETGHMVAISEPSAFIDQLMAKDKAGDARVDQLVRSSVRLLCKRTSLGERGYVIKFWSRLMPYLPTLTSMFPRARAIFIYRDGLKVAQSLCRLSNELPLSKWSYFHHLLKAYLNRVLHVVSRAPAQPDCGWRNIMAVCAANWASNQRLYVEFRESGQPIVGVRYEDIVADPESNMRRILRHCDLPEHWAVDSVRALDEDSQSDSPYASKALRRHGVPQYWGTVRAAVDDVCDHYGVPRFSEVMYIAPGTITSGGETMSTAAAVICSTKI